VAITPRSKLSAACITGSDTSGFCCRLPRLSLNQRFLDCRSPKSALSLTFGVSQGRHRIHRPAGQRAIPPDHAQELAAACEALPLVLDVAVSHARTAARSRFRFVVLQERQSVWTRDGSPLTT